MRPYDPAAPLLSLHVPKCGGQSMRALLELWFGSRLLFHYKSHQAPPVLHVVEGAVCIHGHFNNERGFGATKSYPHISQYITVLRSPLEMATSNYFYWKRKARHLQLSDGRLHPGSEEDYRDIDDFFRKRPRSSMFSFLPEPLSGDDYPAYIEDHFVWIGTTERLNRGVETLASSLGFPTCAIGHINESQRDEVLSPALEEAFRWANRREQALYDYVSSME